MDRQQDLRLLSDKDSIVAELRDNWAKYADDEGVLSVANCVRDYKYTNKEVTEAGLLALSYIFRDSRGACISDSRVETCFEHVLIAFDSTNGDIIIAGCLLIIEAAKRNLLEGILFSTNIVDSDSEYQGDINSTFGGNTAPRSKLNATANPKATTNVMLDLTTTRRRTASVSSGARRYTHHPALIPAQRYQEDELKPTLTSPAGTTTIATSAQPVASRLIRGMLKALSDHISTEIVQINILKALTAMEAIKNSCICETIHESNGSATISHSLSVYPQNPIVQEYGLLALENILGDLSRITTKFTSSDNSNEPNFSNITAHAINAMSNLPNSSGVQAAGCKVLAHLAHGNGINQAGITKSGGFNAVVSALNNHRTDPEVQAAGCLAIGYLMEGNRTAQKVGAQCGAVQSVLDTLKICARDNVKVLENALFALGSATGNNAENIMTLCNEGGVETIVSVLGENGSEERIQHNGCYTLLNMSSIEECIAKLCACGGIAAVIRALYTHLECEEIQEFGCCILGSIAKDTACGPSSVSEIMVEGGIEAIIRSMRHYAKVFQIHNLGVFALTYIVAAASTDLPTLTSPGSSPPPDISRGTCTNTDGNSDNKDLNITQQNQQQLTTSMILSTAGEVSEPSTSTEAPSSPTKAKGKNENGSTTRADEALKRAEECGGIDVITCTVKIYRDIPQVQEFGLALLARIAEHNGAFCAQQILTGRETRGAFGTIIGSLAGHLDKEDTVQSTCKLIGIVAKNARDHCHISEAALVANGLEGVIAAMERYPQNASIQRNALCALAYISSWSLTFRERVGARGGVVRALCAMEAYPADQRIQTYGVQAFAGMAARCPENRTLIGEKGGLFRIAAAMAMHAGNEGLQRASCLAISCLLVDSPKNRSLARTSGCVERLVSAMLAFPDSERLQMLSSSALVSLLSAIVDSKKRSKSEQFKMKKSKSAANVGLMQSLRGFGRIKEEDIDVNDTNDSISDREGNLNNSNSSDDDEMDNYYNNEEERENTQITGEKKNEDDDMNTEAMRKRQEKWLCNPVPGERAALAAMARFPGAQVVQEAGCIILSVLPQSEGGERDFDRVDAVLGAIREHGGACKRIRRCGCAALAAVMRRCTGCAERICGVPGGISALVEAIKTPHIGASTQANGCTVLAGVLHEIYSSHSEVRKYGGVHAIVKAMEKQQKNNGLQRAGCKAISAFTGPPPSSSTPAYSATASDEDISCVIASGGVAALLHAMTKYPGDADIQRFGCKGIARIAGSGKGLTGRLCDDAADLASAALGRHTQNAKLQKWACIALLRLCQLPGGSVGVHKRMAEGMGISAVIAAMRRAPEDAEVQMWGASALGAAAHSDRECQQRIDMENGIECVVEALKRFGDNAGMQRAGCLALAYIAANNPETQRKVGQKEGVSVIGSAMERHPENEDVQRYGCLALGYAALGSSDNQILIVSLQQGIENVVYAMKRFPDAKDVQVNGCFAIVATAVFPDLQQRATAVGGAAAIIAALDRFPKVKHLQDSGVLGLLRLGTPDPVLQRRAESVVSPECVATTLSKSMDSEAARTWCVHMLANIARSGRFCLTRSNSLPDLLITIVSRPGQGNSAELLLESCYLLGFLSQKLGVDVTTRIRNAKGIEALLALVAHPPAKTKASKTDPNAIVVTTQDILREAFFALSLAVKETGGMNAARFVAAHGIEITIQALMRYTDNEELQSNACTTLGNVAKENGDFQRRISEKGGVDAISNAMVMFPDGKILQSRCCKALGAITFNCTEAQNIACKHKCIELITDLLLHTTSLSGRESACYAIRCLTAGNRGTQTHLIACNGHESVIKAINSSVLEPSDDDKTEALVQAVLKNGFMMLMDLTQVTKVAQKRIEEEILPKALLSFMDGGTGSQDVQLWCLRILACIFGAMTNKGWEAIDTSAALKTIITIMDANIKTEQFQHYGCFALATVFRGRITPTLLECAYDASALETIVAAMGHYPENMKIQNNALFSLDALASAAAMTPTKYKYTNLDNLNINALVLGPSSCLDAVVEGMEKFTDFAQIQMLGANVIASAALNAGYNKYVLREYKCIPVLIKTLGRYLTDVNICKSVCIALANLADDSIFDQREIADNKGVETVLATMAQYSDNRDVQFACVNVFGHLTIPETLETLLPKDNTLTNKITNINIQLNNSARSRKKINDNENNITPDNGIQAIIEVLVRYTNDIEIQQSGLTALANVAEAFPAGHAVIAANGGVGTAIAAMSKFPDDVQIQSSGCKILRFTSEALLEEETKKAFEAIEAAASQHTEVLEVQENAMATLKALIDSGVAPDAELQQSMVKTSAEALTKFPENKNVQEGGFAMLSTYLAMSPISADEAGRFYDMGMFELAVNAMKHFPDVLEVQEEACSLLAELAGERPHEDPNSFCGYIVASMLKYPDSARLQCLGCAVFASIRAVTIPTIVDIAVNALQKHLIDEDVVLNSCLVIELAGNSDEATRARIWELSTVESIISAMREHFTNKDVQSAACAALCALPQGLGVRIALNDGCNMMARVIERFSDEEELLRDSIRVLAKVAEEINLSDCLTLQNYGGSLLESPIIIALRSHPGNESLNGECFTLLSKAIHDTDNIRRVIGSVSAFVDSIGVPALKRYAHNADLIHLILDVMATATEDLSGARTFAGIGGLAFVQTVAAAHPTDLTVQGFCATIIGRIIAVEGFHKRFVTKELQAAVEAIAERLDTDNEHKAAAKNLLATLHRDKNRASATQPESSGVCTAQRLFRCVTCSVVRGSCVNLCPECQANHHSPSHRVVELFYPAACTCCTRLDCTKHVHKENDERIVNQEECIDYSTPVLSQRIDALLDSLPPLEYCSLGDSLTAAGFKDTGALLVETREKLQKDVVDNTALGLSAENALAIYVCTHNGPLAHTDNSDIESTTPLTVVNKALHERTPNALYRVRYLLLHLLTAIRKLPRVDENKTLYRVVMAPTCADLSQPTHTSFSAPVSPPPSPFRTVATMTAASIAGKNGDELFQWPCITPAFTDENEALAFAESIGRKTMVYEIHGPITAYAVGALTGRKSEVFLEIETRFEVMKPSVPTKLVLSDDDLSSSLELEDSDPKRICVKGVIDPSGNGLPIVTKVRAFAEIVGNFSPLRGTAISFATSVNTKSDKPTLEESFGVLPQKFYTTANQALQNAGFKHLLEGMHERYMMYVVGSPGSRLIMRKRDITEEDAAIIFSFTYNNGTENSPYTVVGRVLQDPEQLTISNEDTSAEGIHTRKRDLSQSGDNIPLAGLSIRYDRAMSVNSFKASMHKNSLSLSMRGLGSVEDLSIGIQSKQTSSLHLAKTTLASASLPTLPKFKVTPEGPMLQGYVLRLLLALRKLPRYKESDTIYVPAEGDNLDTSSLLPGKTIVWEPLIMATPSKKEALHVLNFCKTNKPVLFEVRGDFYGYNVSPFSSSPSLTSIVLEPETKLKVVGVHSGIDDFKRSFFKIVVEALNMKKLPLEDAVRQFILNAPLPNAWIRDIDPGTQKIYYINYLASKIQQSYPVKFTPADIFRQTTKNTSSTQSTMMGSAMPEPALTGSAGGEGVAAATTSSRKEELGSPTLSPTEQSIPVPSLHITNVTKHSVSLKWDPIPHTIGKETVYNVTRQIPGIDTTKTYIYKGKGSSVTGDGLIAGVTYQYRIHAGTIEKKDANNIAEKWGPWSDRITVSTPSSPFSESCWRPCETSYKISGFPTRFATKTSEDNTRSIVLGNTVLEKGKWYSWSVRIIRSRANNGEGIFVGVAPVDGFSAMGKLHGWYLYCKSITPFSDPTTEYDEPEEFAAPEGGIHNGSVIGLKMDTGTGKLFFSIDGVETGIYIYGIPLDDEVPIVPSVSLNCKDDIVELII